MHLSEIQEALRNEGLDGWLFFDHHERDPLAYRILNFRPPGHVTRRWYYLIPAEGSPRAMVHRVEPTMLDPLPGDKVVYSGWRQQSEHLAGLLEGLRRIAMQYSPNCTVPYVAMVDAGTVELVRSYGVEVVTSANLVQHFEARWSARQLETHLEAGRRVDRIRRAAFDHVGDALRSGRVVTEFEVAQFIRDAFERDGLYTDHGPIVAVNANASNPHYEPTAEVSQVIKPNDVVLMDMWAKLTSDADSVYYDITWTGFAGPQPPDRVVQVFEIVRDARKAGVARVQTAVSACEPLMGYQVDDATRGYIAERGFADYFVHRTGHSIGRDVHGSGANMDNLETHDERRVTPHTCFSVEPGIYLEDFGIRSEVNVYVGADEAIVTGEQQEALVLIG